MKLVNPMGRQAETLETGANYAGDVARGGCACSGSATASAAHYQDPQTCVGYCTGGSFNMSANLEAARRK